MACQNGLDRHLEHLIFYGANLNSRTDTGNTPLHICAIENKDNCARILLFRGADANLVNFSNQTAHDIASISGNSEIAALINDFDSSQIAPFLERPVYSRRRRDPRSNSKASSSATKINTQQSVPENGELTRSITVANKGELESFRGSKEEMYLKNMKKTDNNNLTGKAETEKRRPESDVSGSDGSDSDDETVNKDNKINRRTFSTGALGKKAPAPIKSRSGNFLICNLCF